MPKGLIPTKELGRGEQTAVWEVRDESGRRLAVKLATDHDPSRRLEREFALLKRFEHPGIVKVHEFGHVKGTPYFTMDLVEGLPFDEFFSKKRRSKGFVELFTEAMTRIFAVLSTVHREGVVHADVKPLNLVLTRDAEPVLLDFGFAEDFILAPTHQPRGTLVYVAPELFFGSDISPAADLYSLGVMAYEVLTGKNLWSALSPRALVVAKVNPVQGFRNQIPDIPAELENVVLRLLQTDPALRPSAAEAAGALSGFFKGKKDIQIAAAGFAPRLVFCGREEELARAQHLLFDEKKTVLLKGPRGIGKTRFMHELRFRCLTKKFNVMLVEGRGAHLTLIEHISQSLGLNQASQTAEAAEIRYERVLQAVYRSGLDALFIEAPLELSVYERKGLDFLARGLEGKNGLFLSQANGFKDTAREVLELAPLVREDTAEMIAKTFRGVKDENTLVDTIYAEADGNPTRMNELVNILYREGWLRFDETWIFEKPVGEDILGEKLSTWMSSRINTLPKSSVKVLEALALAEGPLPMAVLASTFDDADIAWILKVLFDSGIIASVTYRGLSHYSLKDNLLREYLLDKLSDKERRAWSSRLAKALERFGKDLWGEERTSWDDSCLVQLAKLYTKAANKAKALGYLGEAGRRLSALYLYRQARELLVNLLEMEPEEQMKKSALIELGRIADIHEDAGLSERYYFEALPLAKDNPEEQASMIMRAGLAHQRVQNLDRAEELFTESEELMGTTSSSLLSAKGWNAMMKGDLTSAETLFRQGMDKAPAHSETRRRTLYMLAWLLFLEVRYQEALTYARQAFEENETAGDRGAACQAALLLTDTLHRQGRLQEAYDYAEKAVEFSMSLEYPSLLAEALKRKSILLGVKGLFRQARSLCKESTQILERTNDNINIPSNLVILANQSRDLGEWTEAEGWYRKLWKLLVDFPITRSVKQYALNEWALLYLAKGELHKARLLADSAHTLAVSKNDQEALAWSQMVYARLALASDDLEGCRKLLTEGPLAAIGEGDLNTLLNRDLLKVELLLAEGENGKALEDAIALSTEIKDRGYENLHGEALRLLGRASIATGDKETGPARLLESAQLLRKQENFYEYGRTLFALADSTFATKGYCDEAVAALEEASVIFERLGAALELERIERFRSENFTEWRIQEGLPSQYLDGLRRISELINYRLGEEDFMLDLLSVTLGLTGAERGIIFLMDEAQLYAVASKRMDSTTQRDARRISKTVIRRIQQGLQPIFTSDATTDERFSRSRSIFLHNIRSILCIPLKTNERLLGTIYLDSQNIGLFDLDRVAYFEALGNLLAATMDKSAEFTRLREELVLSKESRKWEESGVVLGNSKSMREIYNQLERVALSEANVLLEGETGSGKGVLARMIHEKSLRRAREFCSINCGILPENIFESELFGTRKGAYTGASSDRIGLLETADGSTVFFDEITNTSLAMQAKLLEVIDERVIRRFGESRKRKVDLRFIFATNRNLKQEVKEGRFREDLYFRLNTLNLRIPPLRERGEDIPEFTRFFIDKFSRELNKRVSETSEEVMEALMAYPWPGNIRELANVIERGVLLTTGRRITREFLDQRFFPEGGFQVHDLREAKRMEEQELIRRTLLETGGNVTRSAKRIGVSRQHLSRLINRYGITRHPGKP